MRAKLAARCSALFLINQDIGTGLAQRRRPIMSIASEAMLERPRGASWLSCLPAAYREASALRIAISSLKLLINLVGAAGFEPAT